MLCAHNTDQECGSGKLPFDICFQIGYLEFPLETLLALIFQPSVRWQVTRHIKRGLSKKRTAVDTIEVNNPVEVGNRQETEQKKCSNARILSAAAGMRQNCRIIKFALR
jgi:hypothetical protein